MKHHRKRKKRIFTAKKLVPAILLLAVLLTLGFVFRDRIMAHFGLTSSGSWSTDYSGTEPYADTIERDDEFWAGAPGITTDLLDPNPYSRPQIALNRIDAIGIHYTANPGATAKQNRDYFNNLQNGSGRKASSHFIVGLEGEIIQCIPLREIAYASNDRNYDTISIEVCHEDSTGKFNRASYDSLLQLTGWLCKAFRIPPDNIIRHYDVTGKNCPKYYVEHSRAWEQLLADIKNEYEYLSGQ